MFGFLGPNGAGKTTTVRTLATLLSPTSGSATVAGLPLTPENGGDIRRRIAVMPESPGLYQRLSVTENLSCFADLYEVGEPKARIRAALAAVDLEDRANDRCGELSKGLRQRVALARTLLSDPQVLFLDEPTSGLDPAAAREVHELIDGLRKQGKTIFLTTHRLEEAERLCDRVAILNTTLRSIGRPQELRDQLFAKTLQIKTAAPLADPAAVFDPLESVKHWQADGASSYVLTVTDPAVAAPAVTHALVAAGASVISIGNSSARSRTSTFSSSTNRHLVNEPQLRRVRAIVTKEFREYRRNRNVIVAMGVYPLIFMVQPLIAVFAVRGASVAALAGRHELLFMLGIPILVPATLAAFAVAGERQQETLEPIFEPPISREEFLLGKQIAVFVPAVVIAYLVFALYILVIEAVRSTGRSRGGDRPGRHRGPGGFHATPRGVVDLGGHCRLHAHERRARGPAAERGGAACRCCS